MMTSNAPLKTALGPKEGRLPPGRFSPASSERRRRLGSRQKHVVLFTIVLLVLLVYSTYFRSSVLARLEHHGRGIPEKNSWGSPGFDRPLSAGGEYIQGHWHSRFGSRKSVETFPPQKPIVDKIAQDDEKKKPEEEPATDTISTKDHTVVEPATQAKEEKKHGHHPKPEPETTEEESSDNDSSSPSARHWPERPNLKADLDAVFALLPDEMNMRESLRPINNGGPERMRELGLRTRAYQKYLRAWEKLHLVEDPKTGEAYVRDDIIQYLRGAAQVDDDEDSDASPDASLTNTIHNYEAFRGFLAKFARLLFPFTSPYFADHVALHAQFRKAGRGIVLTAGDDQAQYLLTTIYSFRELGCDLPIEVMYLGDPDLGEDHRFELEVSFSFSSPFSYFPFFLFVVRSLYHRIIITTYY